MLTPSGRFEINKKICITNSGYHRDLWQPTWNIKNMMEGFVSIMADDSTKGLSHIYLSPEIRRRMAIESFDYNLKFNENILKKFTRFPLIMDGKIKRMRNDKEVEELLRNKKEKKSLNKNNFNKLEDKSEIC